MKKKLLLLVFVLSSCSSGILKYKGDKEIFKNSDFEEKVVITEDTPSNDKAPKQLEPLTPAVPPTPAPEASAGTATSPGKKESGAKKSSAKKPPVRITKPKKGAKVETPQPAVPAVAVRQPDIEDSVGFEPGSRRPIKDPFRVGEVVTHSVRYFSAEAGRLSLQVKPFVEVNGRKSYNFVTELKTSSLFSKFYSVEDKVETYVDYQELVPHVFKLHIKETAQLKEAQSYFDHQKLRANYWENKYTEKSGHEEKKQQWDILPFSQNAFSGIFYMRIFKFDLGKEYSFRVADDEKNITFKAVALNKEKLNTDAGTFNAIKIKASVVSRGALEQVGDLYFWVSDDDRKYVLRIEAKIKIGTLVSEVVSIKPGSEE